MHCTGKGLLRRNSLIREKYEAFKLEPSARPHTFVRGNNQTNHIFSNNPNAFQVRAMVFLSPSTFQAESLRMKILKSTAFG
jgi:hypothetical protein